MSRCDNCGYSDIPDRFSPPEVFWCDEYGANLCGDCLEKMERDEREREEFEVAQFHYESGE